MAKVPIKRAAASATRRLLADTRAASAAEYALLLGLIGGSIALGALALGNSVACSINGAALVINGTIPDPGHQYGNSDPRGNAFGQHRSTC